MVFFILFISIALIEIYLFLKIGEIIGSFETILLIIFTAIIGSVLIKIKGTKTLNNLKYKNINEPKLFIKELGNGFFIVISGILLLTPGFITDIIGFSLFFKFSRNYIIKFILNKVELSKFSKFNKHD
tara:strand:+ start:45 stop:428 length:384 start_codon:yes stop_codon:yes gene_type:complete